MNLQTEKQRRSKTVTEMRTLTETAATESRDLSEKESTRFDELRGNLTSIEKNIERAEIINEEERKMNAEPGQELRAGTYEHECRNNFKVLNLLASSFDHNIDAGREKELSKEAEIRGGKSAVGFLIPLGALVTTEQRALLAGGSGGPLIPDNHRPDLHIDPLRPKLQVASLGSTTLPNSRGNLQIPRTTQSLTAQWVGEHVAPASSDMAFDSVLMTPKTVSAITEASRAMMISGSPEVENIFKNDLLNVMATELDRAAINGSGVSNQPLGILNTPGIGNVSHGVDGGAATYASILDLIDALEIDEALMGKLGFLTNSAVVKTLRNTVKVSGTDSQMIMNDPGSLVGYALRKTSHVPKDGAKGAGTNLSSLIFGNWSDLLISYWSGIDVLVNPFADSVYSKGGVLINSFLDVDIAVRHPESFSAATDLVTA